MKLIELLNESQFNSWGNIKGSYTLNDWLNESARFTTFVHTIKKHWPSIKKINQWRHHNLYGPIISFDVDKKQDITIHIGQSDSANIGLEINGKRIPLSDWKSIDNGKKKKLAFSMKDVREAIKESLTPLFNKNELEYSETLEKNLKKYFKFTTKDLKELEMLNSTISKYNIEMDTIHGVGFAFASESGSWANKEISKVLKKYGEPNGISWMQIAKGFNIEDVIEIANKALDTYVNNPSGLEFEYNSYRAVDGEWFLLTIPGNYRQWIDNTQFAVVNKDEFDKVLRGLKKVFSIMKKYMKKN